MHIKCLRRGTGSAGRAAGYLVGERDAIGRERNGVEVLRGDPDMVAAVADSLDFEHKYRSIVIAWAPEDRPTDSQINAVLDEFEKTAWAGLEPDRYAWTAVLHREHGGGVHVRVLTARCDLETGKSLNIAPPGWQKTFDPLRDAFNHEHGWSRPDDPARARTQQPAGRPPAPGRPAASPLDRGRSACLEAVERVRRLYDRARAAVAAGRGEQDLAAANRAALGATEMLGRGLQDARRDVARAVELMQQRGPERDSGPSR